jgi:hypothetical protein
MVNELETPLSPRQATSKLRLYDLFEAFDNVVRGRVSGFHDALNFLADLGGNLHTQLFGIAKELRIVQDGSECIAQHFDLFERHARRDEISFAESLLETHHQCDRFAIDVVIDGLMLS